MSIKRRARFGLAMLILGAGTAAALEQPAAAPTSPPAVYFSASQIDPTALIEPPPVAGSEAAQRDLAAVIARQHAALRDGTLERGIGDADLNCRRVAEVLEPPAAGSPPTSVPSPSTPSPSALAGGEGAAAIDFASRAALQVAGATGPPKQYWHRPRPYMVSAEVVRRADVAPDYPMPALLAQQREFSSYPSGHTAFGTACAIVLAQMVPEQRVALFARARLYSESRMIVGAHYPTDIEAGRIVGTAAAAVMLQNHQFQEDLAHARTGLRAALGLAGAPP